LTITVAFLSSVPACYSNPQFDTYRMHYADHRQPKVVLARRPAGRGPLAHGQSPARQDAVCNGAGPAPGRPGRLQTYRSIDWAGLCKVRLKTTLVVFETLILFSVLKCWILGFVLWSLMFILYVMCIHIWLRVILIVYKIFETYIIQIA